MVECFFSLDWTDIKYPPKLYDYRDLESYHFSWLLEQIDDKNSMQMKAIKIYVQMRKSDNAFTGQLLNDIRYIKKKESENLAFVVHLLDYW